MNEIEIKKLKAAEYNPRKISEKELNQLKKSLKRFGFVEPVVVNKDWTLIGGHQRVRAWEELGNEKVPYIQVSIDKTKEKALNLALNKISGEWDTDKLFSVISDLKISEELDFTGFDEKEISKILDGMIEDAEEEPLAEILEKAPTKAKRGDKFQLGNHTLKCGDSLNMDDIKDLVGDEKIDMAWTDPPYNVNYESSVEDLGSIKNDNMSDDEFKGFITSAFAGLWSILKSGAPIYICSGWQSFTPFKEALENNEFHISEVIIWVKNQAGIHTIDYPHKHEQIIKAKKLAPTKKKKAKAIFYGWKKGKHAY
jgi:ParB family chromosome partitioning protein